MILKSESSFLYLNYLVNRTNGWHSLAGYDEESANSRLTIALLLAEKFIYVNEKGGGLSTVTPSSRRYIQGSRNVR
jgi:hypothetical protein